MKQSSSSDSSLSLMWKPQIDYIKGVTFQPTNWVELEQLASYEDLVASLQQVLAWRTYGSTAGY